MAEYAFMMRGSREDSRLYLRQTAKRQGISMGEMFDRLVQMHQSIIDDDDFGAKDSEEYKI